MTSPAGPSNPTPPGGPGRDHLDDSALLDVIATATAAAAPPLTDQERAKLRASSPGPTARRVRRDHQDPRIG